MKLSQYKTVAMIVGVTLALTAFQNCGEVEFAQQPKEEAGSTLGNPAPPQQPPPNVICDPFDRKNIVDPKAGIEGSLYYTPARLEGASCMTPNACTSRDYITQGTKVDAVLFLSQIFVATRNFTEGFEVQGQGRLQDANKNDLVEWFALDLRSQFVLDAADEAGDYQMAIISDDGHTLSVGGADIVKDEGEHAPRLACSAGTLSLNHASKIPFQLTYFQGPRTQISLVVMWRKVDSATNLQDCGSSDGYINDQNQLPHALASRGWKVLKSSNYLLNNGRNLCAAIN